MICSRELIKLCNICIDGSGHKPYNDADEQWSCVYSHKVIELEEAIQNLMITGIVEDWRWVANEKEVKDSELSARKGVE